ncbi:unnamed protein product [Gongylonema pulchrum]|uniref:60S ribosomal protein L6 n=1 Tax=Gongylonema pulchrum TaxID=637853 RepID=A0A183DD31_9BILA|nr:unnamed protein product [Gongylonema pulchrum]
MKLNSTPLRRIAQAFVIATKTKIDVSEVKVPEHIDDNYFRRFTSKKSPRKGDANIFTQGTTVSLFWKNFLTVLLCSCSCKKITQRTKA